MYFAEAVTRYNNEKFDKKSIANDQYYFAELMPFFGDRTLDQIDMNALWPYIHYRRSTVKNSTINRELEVVRHILNLAKKEWCRLETVPYIRMLKEPPPRVRFLSRREADRLMLALPPHLQPVVQYAIATGCRASEILSLEWSRVDLDRKVAWLDHGTTKNGHARGIPLNNDAMISLSLAKAHGCHCRYVFTYCGQKMGSVGSAWRRALKRADINDFRFHDLRHTFASWHVMAGTSLIELMELGGWKTIDCVLRYAHLAPCHLSAAASRIESINPN